VGAVAGIAEAVAGIAEAVAGIAEEVGIEEAVGIEEGIGAEVHTADLIHLVWMLDIYLEEIPTMHPDALYIPLPCAGRPEAYLYCIFHKIEPTWPRIHHTLRVHLIF